MRKRNGLQNDYIAQLTAEPISEQMLLVVVTIYFTCYPLFLTHFSWLLVTSLLRYFRFLSPNIRLLRTLINTWTRVKRVALFQMTPQQCFIRLLACVLVQSGTALHRGQLENFFYDKDMEKGGSSLAVMRPSKWWLGIIDPARLIKWWRLCFTRHSANFRDW